MIAVEHDSIRREPLLVELRDRTQPRGAQCRGHAQLVTLLVRCVTHPDGDGPPAHCDRRLLTVGAVELLRVAHAPQVLGRRHHCSHGDRARPRTASNFVDAAHHLLPRRPHLPFESQRGAGVPGRRSGGRHEPTLAPGSQISAYLMSSSVVNGT